MHQLQHAKRLGHGLAHGGLVAGPQLVVQGHPGKQQISVRLVHNVQRALHGIGIPRISGDGLHGGGQNLVNVRIGHGGGYRGGHGLRAPDSLAVVADGGVNFGHGNGAVDVACAQHTHGADAHRRAIGMPICIVPARQRGTQALTQISGGFKFARATPLELILRGHVLEPCIHHAVAGGSTAGFDQNLRGEHGKLRIVGGPACALVEIRGKAISHLVFRLARSVAEAVANGQADQRAARLVAVKVRVLQ